MTLLSFGVFGCLGCLLWQCWVMVAASRPAHVHNEDCW